MILSLVITPAVHFYIEQQVLGPKQTSRTLSLKLVALPTEAGYRRCCVRSLRECDRVPNSADSAVHYVRQVPEIPRSRCRPLLNIPIDISSMSVGAGLAIE